MIFFSRNEGSQIIFAARTSFYFFEAENIVSIIFTYARKITGAIGALVGLNDAG